MWTLCSNGMHGDSFPFKIILYKVVRGILYENLYVNPSPMILVYWHGCYVQSVQIGIQKQV
jgi:hypothetical protein